VRRAGLAAILLAACAVAGILAALALADTPPPATTEGGTTVTGATGTETTVSTSTSTTAPTTTATTATTTTTSTTTTPSRLLPAGVRVGGVKVGGLAPLDAAAVVKQAFATPLLLRYGHTKIFVSPDILGAVPYVNGAVARGLAAAPRSSVGLVVGVRRSDVAAFVAGLAERFDREPVDAQLVLRKLKPVIKLSGDGVRLDKRGTTSAIVRALVTNQRKPIVVHTKLLKPKVLTSAFRSIIVIRRGSNQLYLYDGMKLRRRFGVATGQSVYPTPLGRFQIIVKWKDPWWYPPASPWAKGEKPVPPGPGNPLGTRWMGISSPGVGIHGTPDAASIGYSASHGCIRMLIPNAEWLFDHVEIGTPVFIVAA
jgi:lipoprotein-anchoring transpeptidase ErfK/SrfK